MEEQDIETQIGKEQIIKDGISSLIDTICSKAAPIYPHVCARANRSVEDRRKIIEMVFDLVIQEATAMTPDSALAKVESELDWDQD